MQERLKQILRDYEMPENEIYFANEKILQLFRDEIVKMKGKYWEDAYQAIDDILKKLEGKGE